jgi:hypothetical protein
MLLTSLFLLALAAALLAIYTRGYVVARGRFCRTCKFDLAGLHSAPACPECGEDLSKPAAASPALLHKHRGVLGAGIFLLICSLTMLAYLGVTNRNHVLPRLPNTILMPLEAVGYSEARTVLAMRAQDPQAFTDAQWQTLLTRALAHQADTTIPWDTRWGDVLARAFANRLMTEAQMRAYLEAGLTVTVQIRDRATVDQERLGYEVQFGYKRIQLSRPLIGTGNPSGLQTPFNFSQFSEAGLKDLSDTRPVGGSGVNGELYIPWVGGGVWSRLSNGIRLRGFLDRDVPPGEIVAFVDVPLILTDRATGEEILVIGPRRTQQIVRILPPGTPIVSSVTDEALATQVRKTVKLTAMTIDPTEEAMGADSAVRVFMHLQAVPHAIAGHLFAVSPDGHETRIASLSVPAGTSTRYQLGTTMPTERDIQTRPDRFRDWLQAGKVDLVFRTDPEVAKDNPAIDTIVDVTLWFRRLPVVHRENDQTRSGRRLLFPPEGVEGGDSESTP